MRFGLQLSADEVDLFTAHCRQRFAFSFFFFFEMHCLLTSLTFS